MTLRAIIFPLAVVLITIAMSCSQTEEPAATQERPTTSIEAQVVTTASPTMIRTFTGSIEGERQTDVFAKIAEAVQEVHVREGEAVKSGQKLVSLDRTGPSSAYRSAESVYRNAEKHYQKMKYLYDQGAVSESEYDAARTAFEVNEAAFEAAARLVEVESPITGIVTSLDISPGDYLYQGQHLVTIAATERLRAKLAVNTKDIDYFEEGAAVSILAETIGREVDGKVASVSRSADPVTRAFEVEVLFENVEGSFRPGMFVRVSLVIESLADVVLIPRAAVVELAGHARVFTVVAGKAAAQNVTLGSEIEGGVVILDGISPGDTLVTVGQSFLDDGYPVRITVLNEAAQ